MVYDPIFVSLKLWTFPGSDRGSCDANRAEFYQWHEVSMLIHQGWPCRSSLLSSPCLWPGSLDFSSWLFFFFLPGLFPWEAQGRKRYKVSKTVGSEYLLHSLLLPLLLQSVARPQRSWKPLAVTPATLSTLASHQATNHDEGRCPLFLARVGFAFPWPITHRGILHS